MKDHLEQHSNRSLEENIVKEVVKASKRKNLYCSCSSAGTSYGSLHNFLDIIKLKRVTHIFVKQYESGGGSELLR
jgi:hypothetical protein